MQRLRSAGRFPTGRNYAFEYSLEIIDKQRNVNVSNIAGRTSACCDRAARDTRAARSCDRRALLTLRA